MKTLRWLTPLVLSAFVCAPLYGQAAEVSLQQHAEDRAACAAALSNLASLKMANGDVNASATLRKQARDIYQQLGDHAGVARIDGSLVHADLAAEDWKSARKDMDMAFREAKRAGNYPDSDTAALLADRASLLSFENDNVDALRQLNRAIELWGNSHGPDTFLLGVGYSLRAQAYDKLGDAQRAARDMQQALTILAETIGKGSPEYRATEAIYAQILGHGKELDHARLVDQELRQSAAGIGQHPCPGCGINTVSVR